MTCCSVVEITHCLFSFFFLNSHLKRQCVFVKLIVIHLFTSLVNKWDHYSVCGGSDGGGGVKVSIPVCSHKVWSSQKNFRFVRFFFLLLVRRNKSEETHNMVKNIRTMAREAFALIKRKKGEWRKRPNQAETNKKNDQDVFLFLRSGATNCSDAERRDDAALFFFNSLPSGSFLCFRFTAKKTR